MRKAAGIILIVLGAVILAGTIITVSALVRFMSYGFVSTMLSAILSGIAYGGLLLAGGVFCLKRGYWGLCLVSALFVFVHTIPRMVAMLPYPYGSLGASVGATLGYITFWEDWILIVGTLIATIFISLTKKEWQEFPDSVDSEVSNGG
jgi:hypothetical protein